MLNLAIITRLLGIYKQRHNASEVDAIHNIHYNRRDKHYVLHYEFKRPLYVIEKRALYIDSETFEIVREEILNGD